LASVGDIYIDGNSRIRYASARTDALLGSFEQYDPSYSPHLRVPSGWLHVLAGLETGPDVDEALF